MAGSARVTAAYLCCLLFAFAAIRSCSASSYELQVVVTKADVMRVCRANLEKNLGQPFPDKNGACCQHVRSVNVRQICQQFTAADKAYIALHKWVTVARVCDRPLPVGFNCAGYIVPRVGSH
ncbi:unnamed protein product [Urochloa humidicola]